MRVTIVLASVFVATVAAVTIALRPGPHEREIARWREAREASLTGDDGWLTVAGLYFLEPGGQTFGSDPGNDFVLPAGPPRAGVFHLDEGRVRVELAAGVDGAIDGRPVRDAELRPASEGRPPDTLVMGRLALFLHHSGDRLAIRLRDRENPLRRTFAGCRWYPIEKAFRVEGRFEPYAEPAERHVPNVLGDLEHYTASGLVVFLLHGTEQRLEAFDSTGPDGPRLFFVFRDATSGRETYGAARFLYADAPDGKGRVVLDFNKAYNPPCAFNPHTTCPLPPPMNVLEVGIEAGELDARE